MKNTLKKVRAMVRGGKRHFPKPRTDGGLVLKVFRDNMDNVTDLGEYESLSRNSGISPHGLVQNIKLLEDIVSVEPTAELHPQPIKAALLRILQDDSKVNQTKFNGNVWINLRQERLTCILYHLRRLSRDQECQKTCAVRLNGCNFHRLRALLVKMEVREEEELNNRNNCSGSFENVPLKKEGEGSLTNEEGGSLTNEGNGSLKKGIEEEETKAALPLDVEEHPAKKMRTLKKEVSAVSVTSDGFPKMLQSPVKQSPCRKGVPSSVGCRVSEEAWNEEQKKKTLRTAMGFVLKKPAALKKEEKKEQPAEQHAEVGPVEGCKWFKLSKTVAKNPERSYIMGSLAKGQKMRLIVEVPRTWSSKYSEIIDQIMQQLREKHLTKDQAKELRSELCKQYP